MFKKLLLLALIGFGLVWTYYWYVRGVNLLLEEQFFDDRPALVVRLPGRDKPVTEPTWSIVTAMPTPRTAAAAAAIGNEIYVVGGQDGFMRSLATVEVFNTKTSEWRTSEPLPEAVHRAAVASADGQLYVFGGLKGVSSEPTKSAYAYNPADRTWRVVASLPRAFGGSTAVTVDGHIHLFGGESLAQTSAQHLAYDYRTNAWSELEDLVVGGRDRSVAVKAGGKVYLLGGREGSTLYNTAEAWEWDINGDRWEDAPPMGSKRSSFAAGLGDRLYAIGGALPTAVNPTVEAFDFQARSWTSIPPMPRPRFAMAFAQVGNHIYLFGGSARTGFSVSDFVDVLEVPPAAVTPAAVAPTAAEKKP
jgi:N-acetylneuraminic acid mutarotase